MNLQRITLENFLSHRDTDFDVSGRNPVIVTGGNGAGKSSLVKDSVTWALFGKARASGDELIAEGTSEAAVTIRFRLDGHDYAVTRRRVRGKKTELEFAMVEAGMEQRLCGATIAETQAEIEKRLGMDYETFVCTACVEQGKADSFTVMTPKEAKQLIMRILQLGDYERYLEQARAEVHRWKTAVAQEEGQLAVLMEELSRREPTANDLIEVQHQLTTLEQERASIRDQVVAADSRLADAESELLQVQRRIAEQEARLPQLAQTHQKTREHLERLSEPVSRCPLCRSPLTEKAQQCLREELGRQVEASVREQQEVHVSLQLLERKAGEQADVCARLRTGLTTLRAEEQKLSSLMTEVARQAGMAQTRMEDRLVLEQKISGLKQELAETVRRVTDYGMLERAFGKDGIVALVVENVLPEIEATANDILGLLSDHTLTLELRTQKALKSGEVSDTLEIRVIARHMPRLYEHLSGGEKFRVDVAVRIALSKVLARRNNFKIETLIIDEGFGSLDAIGRQKFVELSRLLGDQFKRIIVITHTDIQDLYGPGDLVCVRREDGISRIDL